MALARAPGVVGQIGRVAGTVGRAVDPINAALKAAGGVPKASDMLEQPLVVLRPE